MLHIVKSNATYIYIYICHIFIFIHIYMKNLANFRKDGVILKD